MDKKHRERGDNWTTEEKEILMKIMKESTAIIEDKRTDTNSNKRKVAEWQKVQNKLQELTSKRRDISQIKGFWRRIKLAAKKSYSDHRRAVHGTGGGPKPTSPTGEVQDIMEMCPTDFIEEKNEFDSDSIFMKDVVIKDVKKQEEIVVTPDNKFGNLLVIEDDGRSTLLDVEEDVELEDASFVIEDVVIDDINSPNNEIILKRTALHTKKGNIENHIPAKKSTTQKKFKTESEKTKTHKAGASHKNIILENNLEFKEKTFKLMEEEYALKIAYQKQELCHQELRHKFEIDILMLEKEKKAMELNILKKNNNII